MENDRQYEEEEKGMGIRGWLVGDLGEGNRRLMMVQLLAAIAQIAGS